MASEKPTESDLQEALKSLFGFEEFQPGQLEVMSHLMAGHSAAAVFPTGAGKSLCYQLPALLLPGLTLVVSPLIALMKDQIDALQARGIDARRLDSSLSHDEHREVMSGLRSGTLRLLYVAPERFNNERFREAVLRARISLFAVDEAHCISEWGHDFRPDYLKLASFAKRCGAERVLALTATATEKVLVDCCRAFGIEEGHAVRTGFHRPNLGIVVSQVAAAGRDDLLLSRLRHAERGATIIYVTLQRTAEAVASLLQEAGLPARHYHAGLSAERRSEVQDWFMESGEGIVVATIAFGMGVDKANIRHVIHYNLAKSLENFSQEIGRAGRDGEPSTCESLVCLDDLTTLENFALGDTPTLGAVESLMDELFSEGESFHVAYQQLGNRHDVRVLVLRTLLTQLELDGYLEGGTPFYSVYRYRPLVPIEELTARFQGERREFLDAMFAQAEKAVSWFDIDVDEAAGEIGADRDRIVRALDYFAEQELLELSVKGVRHRYRRLREPDDVKALAAELHRGQLEHEQRELDRLQQFLDLVQHDGCQAAFLGRHFGESLEKPCGRCSHCLSGGTPLILRERLEPEIPQDVWEQLRELRDSAPAVLASPRGLARFACGLSSPASTKAKLGRHALFGILRTVPFRRVLERAEKVSGTTPGGSGS